MAARSGLALLLVAVAALAAPAIATAAFPGRNGRIVVHLPQVGLVSVDATGLHRETVFADGAASSPAFAPDGRTLAFADAGDLWLSRPDGSGSHTIRLRLRDAHSPIWLPGGRRLSFASFFPDPDSACGEECVGESLITRFYSVGRDGRKLRRAGINPDRTGETRALPSPNGRFSAYELEPANCSRIAIRRRRPGARARLLRDGCRFSAVDWSPTSRSLLIALGEESRVPLCACPGETDLYTVRRDGTRLRRITTFGGYMSSPQWSPDGRWIVFGRDSNNVTGERRSGVWIVRATGGRPRLIVAGADSPAWRPLPRRR